MNTLGVDRTKATINSSRWAAYGDALGFITELADERTVKHRAGVARIERTREWRRRIGGQFGVEAHLPAGAYSDDTQLRLATCRAIRGDGQFDVEAFSKVELPVWLAYSLGAGSATKSAAGALTRPLNTWSTNFFTEKTSRYVDSGGNGAAMRVQPHVWCARDVSNPLSYLQDVLRNSLCTHGHPRGFVGAAFHAFTLALTIAEGAIPRPHYLRSKTQELGLIADVIRRDHGLQDFWLMKWEAATQRSLFDAIAEALRELDDLLRVGSANDDSGELVGAYERIVSALKLRDSAFRGCATNTAVAAYLLAWLGQEKPGAAITIAANALGTDTDSVATMAGALLGLVTAEEPNDPIQDLPYIEAQAHRLAAIAQGSNVEAFAYPDLLRWQPPQSQSDAVGIVRGKTVLAGIDYVREDGPQFVRKGKKGAAPLIWRWYSLASGQSILAKVREPLPALPNEALPAPHRPSRPEPPREQRNLAESQPSVEHPRLLLVDSESGTSESRSESRDRESAAERKPISVPDFADLLARLERADFSPSLIGRYIMRFSEIEHGSELVAAFAAMLVRSIKERQKRQPTSDEERR